MQIVSLSAENFKILKAVEIAPDGNIVTIGGKNGAGKTSVLDAIWVALVGRSAAPPKPIRDGEETCTIVLDMGELKVTRRFTNQEGGKFTDSVKVEDEHGRRYPRPQEALDALLGEIGFDPFEFVRKKPDAQAEMLLKLVPLPIDIDELEEQDSIDYATRRDVNRDLKAKAAQLDGIPQEVVAQELPDRDALLSRLSSAADRNASLNAERQRRAGLEASVDQLVAQQREWRDQISALEEKIRAAGATAEQIRTELEELPDVEPNVDTNALREEIALADELLGRAQRMAEREKIAAEVAQLQKRSDDLTAAMAQRETDRTKALAEAKMPVKGLGFQSFEGKRFVTFNGQPFEQASKSQQIRVSAAIAMAANPELRVLRISDGSLLDEDAMEILGQMAEAEEFQLWIEKVGDGGVGFIIENGEVKRSAAE